MFPILWRVGLQSAAYLLVAILPLVIAYFGVFREGRGFWIEFGVGLGMVAFALLGMQSLSLDARAARSSGRYRAADQPLRVCGQQPVRNAPLGHRPPLTTGRRAVDIVCGEPLWMWSSPPWRRHRARWLPR